MRILYIDHYAGSPVLGMEFRPYSMARQWGRQGHETIIVAADRSHLRSDRPLGPYGADSDKSVRGVSFDWVKTPKYEGNGLRRVWNMLIFSGRLWLRARRYARMAPDVVIASSTYTWDIFGARRIAILAGARLVFEVHDLWPLTPMSLAGMSRWNPFILALQWGEDVACKYADKVVSILPYANRHLVTRGMKPEKYTFIPNGVDDSEEDSPVDAEVQHLRAIVHRCRRAGMFVVGYAGGHGEANGLDGLIDAAVKLKDKSIAFVLIGKGTRRAHIIERATALGLANVYFEDSVTKPSIAKVLPEFDALFVGWEKSPLYVYGVGANKLLDYMNSGRPIVHAVASDWDLVATHACGVSVNAGDADALASAFYELSVQPTGALDQLGARGRQAVQRFYRYEILASQYLDVIAPGEREGAFEGRAQAGDKRSEGLSEVAS